ncbi:MAG TPA: hypothetical protein VKG82_01085 [Solirubrobacteraceae bacterium]|nr:hypothetical protein [Solirubrobacteraceae bacterium]
MSRARALSVGYALAASIVVALLILATAGAARADVFGPISLVSEGSVQGGPAEQADYTHDATISGDGRYVAFDGRVGGVAGVWRRDLATGAIEQVAGGDAELPSISEDGQLVSFTTNEGRSLASVTDNRPVTDPTGEAVNVYVRNMAIAPGEAGAFSVVSAPSGSEEPLRYDASAKTSLGSSAVGRSAISADGTEVAFVTTAISNLIAYPALEEEERLRGETPVPHTPAGQVAVRRLNTGETILVSGQYDAATGETTQSPVSTPAGVEPELDRNPPLGAVFPGSQDFLPRPEYDQAVGSPPGASISADGSTVAWMGANIGEQAPMLAGEHPLPHYTEPLWRRIEPPLTPTERVTGGSEPGNPACVASGEASLPSSPAPADPCQGPFVVNPAAGPGGFESSGIWSERGEAEATNSPNDFVPRLSREGYEVAFASTALPLPLGENFNASRKEGESADVFVADMHPGLSRRAALTPLTELAGATSLADTAPIDEFAISPSGEQVAFTTRRTAFPLSRPALVSAPAAEPGLNELFEADLGNGTLTRVTHGYGGEPAELLPHEPKRPGEEDVYAGKPGAGSDSPSFSADGLLLAFSSTASNLVYGDGNRSLTGELGDGSDAFLVAREVPIGLPTPQSLSAPPQTDTAPGWLLGVSAKSEGDGSVRIYARTPGAGVLSASARAAIVSRSAHSKTARRSAHRPGHARAKASRSVAQETVASVRRAASAPAGELAALVLRLGKKFASLAGQPGGFSASVSLVFTAAGHAALRETIEVTFLRRHVKAKGGAARKRKRGRR